MTEAASPSPISLARQEGRFHRGNAIQMTGDEFNVAYPLRPNHFNPGAAWASSDGTGCLFETYGDELKFVLTQDPRTIWTLVEGDAGSFVLVSGYHRVNRIGYLISTVPVSFGTFIEYVIPQDSN